MLYLEEPKYSQDMSTFGTSLRASAFSSMHHIRLACTKNEQPNQAPGYKPIVEAKNNWTVFSGIAE